MPSAKKLQACKLELFAIAAKHTGIMFYCVDLLPYIFLHFMLQIDVGMLSQMFTQYPLPIYYEYNLSINM